MAHKVLVGGTAYEIKGGRTLVNGTGYSIKKGRALVGGIGYDVTLAEKATLRIQMETYDSMAGFEVYVNDERKIGSVISNSDGYVETEYDVNTGDEIRIEIYWADVKSFSGLSLQTYDDNTDPYHKTGLATVSSKTCSMYLESY